MNTNGSQAGWFIIIPIGAIIAWLGLGSPASQPTTVKPEDRAVTMGLYNRVNQGMSGNGCKGQEWKAHHLGKTGTDKRKAGRLSQQSGLAY